MEMYPDSIHVESIAAPSPILAPKGEETNIDQRIDFRWIDLRTEKNTLMFKAQSLFINKIREFLVNNNFIEIHSPKLIGAESESGAGVFEVGYFDDSMNCTYKISDVSIDDILKTENEKYIRIEEIAKVTDFKMGINLVIQDMIKETLK
jgi:aspartyl/asparaginyl-tRNA synthetase